MKNYSIYLSLLCVFGIMMTSSCKREGCTNPNATNYDAKAKKDDGSCVLPNNGTNSEDGTNPNNEEMAPCEQAGVGCLVAEKVVENTAFAGRTGHGCVVFNGKLYVIGGVNVIGSTAYHLHDVWSSSDGENWTLEVSEASFPKRAYHATVVHDNKLWVIGGRTTGYSELNDVWYSEDGINWVEATSNAQFSERQFHQVVSFQNEMYLIGGNVLFDDGDIWKSSNGVNWSLITETAQIGGRISHSLDVYDGKIWLFAGRMDGLSKRDVWNSSDGINWTEVTAQESFTSRLDHSAFNYMNKQYVVGGKGAGLAGTSSFRNDLWVSSDNGVNWSQYAALEEDFLDRSNYKAIPFNNHIYIIGGRVNEVDAKDIWRINPL